MILGCDVLHKLNAVIDFGRRSITFGDENIEIPVHSMHAERKKPQQKFALSINTVSIPAFSEAYITVSVPRCYNGQNVLLETTPAFQFRQFACARSLSTCNNGKATCKIVNPHPRAMTLHRNKIVAAAVSYTHLTLPTILRV